jgi:prepilin-type N-terminal cleavage/methylation domain-containing protein
MKKACDRLKADDGFTILEVLIAALILVLGALAVFMTLSAAIHNAQRGKETQVGLTVAQREMEKIHSLPYEKILLKTTPVNSAKTSEPNNRVSGTTFNLNRTGTPEYATMAISSSGEVEPTSTAFSVGGTSVTVYRYVVWRKDAAYCATGTNSEKEICKAGQNYKRVIIDVVPNQPANVPNTRAYYELQSDFVNPNP